MDANELGSFEADSYEYIIHSYTHGEKKKKVIQKYLRLET